MILIFDMYNIAYASYHALKDQISGADPAIPALFGTLKTIISRCELTLVYSNVVLVFDNTAFDERGRVPTWRHALCPEYKANRRVYRDAKDQREKEVAHGAVHSALEQLRRLSTVLPVSTVERDNTEADDIIGLLVRNWSSPPFEYIMQVVSGDKDMRQLVSKNVNLWIPQRGVELMLTNFGEVCRAKAKPPIAIQTPEEWLLFRALMGDPSDNIEGVNGFGEVSAGKAVMLAREFMQNNNPSLQMEHVLCDNAARILSSGDVRGWKSLASTLMTKAGRERLERNYTLMDIREGSYALKQCSQGVPPTCARGAYNRELLWAWLHEKEFRSIMDKFHVFDTMYTKAIQQ